MAANEERFMTYIAKEGEGIADVSKRFAIDVELLARYNGTEPVAGWRLRIPLLWRMCPHGLFYPLGRQESLYDVFTRFGVTLYALLLGNPCLNPLDVFPGQILIVHGQNKEQSP
ncbi:LysM peptidoglycan-binding domain-containing protein [Eubacteriales bacterium OttesenSCG-928-M02]|nr:LysM peptidoglycan-binding domain-containing protein [Eubacteriales bacterium OttesenSCG-928-M02]